MRLCRLVSRRAEIGRSGATALEESGKHWLENRAEDNLGAASVNTLATCSRPIYTRRMDLPGLGKGHPQDENKLEGVVEGEPVNSVHCALEYCQEGVDNPVLVAINIRFLT